MKKILTELFIFFLLILSSHPATAFKVGGLKNPESVIIDPTTGIYYISGHSKSTGYIWKVDTAGKQIPFIKGGKNGVALNSPKGLALSRDQLYVADGKSIHRFDKTTGVLLGTIDLLGMGGNTLQGLTFANEGQLFVSDSPKNSIYKIETQNQFNVSVFVRNSKLSQPTGITFDAPRNRLIVLGRNQILSVGMDRQVAPIVNKTFQDLVGVCWDRQGNLLVSDRTTGKIYSIHNFSILETVRQNILTPAGISFDYAQNQILIPSTKGKLVFSFPLK